MGRGHQALAEVFVTKLCAFYMLFDTVGTPHSRKRALKHWPWWPPYIEALYRGKCALAREKGIAALESEGQGMKEEQ
jgi:hypothetical protein